MSLLETSTSPFCSILAGSYQAHAVFLPLAVLADKQGCGLGGGPR